VIIFYHKIIENKKKKIEKRKVKQEKEK